MLTCVSKIVLAFTLLLSTKWFMYAVICHTRSPHIKWVPAHVGLCGSGVSCKDI